MREKVIIAVWLAAVVLYIANRDKISIRFIVDNSPSNGILAALFIWALLAVKSLTVVVSSAIMFIASGMMFPVYIAVPVNIVGSIVMITIPYLIGKRKSNSAIADLTRRYPKLNKLHDFRTRNDILCMFLIRITGLVPSDPVSLYMGACNEDYLRFVTGSVLGMLPGMILVTLFGNEIGDVSSPFFMIAVIIDVIITLACIILLNKKSDTGGKTV